MSFPYHHEFSGTPYSLVKSPPDKKRTQLQEGYSYPGVMTPEQMEENRGTWPGDKKPITKT